MRETVALSEGMTVDEKAIDSGTDSTVYSRFMNGETLPSGFMRSGNVARIAGVSTDTLRHYERKGLLTPRRSPNGYREYPPQTIERIRMIRRALAVGFTLDELTRIFTVRDRGGVPCREARALAATKLESIEAQILDMAALRDELHTLLLAWDERLAKTPEGEQARLLETWAANDLPTGETPPALCQRWSTHTSQRRKG